MPIPSTAAATPAQERPTLSHGASGNFRLDVPPSDATKSIKATVNLTLSVKRGPGCVRDALVIALRALADGLERDIAFADGVGEKVGESHEVTITFPD